MMELEENNTLMPLNFTVLICRCVNVHCWTEKKPVRTSESVLNIFKEQILLSRQLWSTVCLTRKGFTLVCSCLQVLQQSPKASSELLAL